MKHGSKRQLVSLFSLAISSCENLPCGVPPLRSVWVSVDCTSLVVFRLGNLLAAVVLLLVLLFLRELPRVKGTPPTSPYKKDLFINNNQPSAQN